MDNVHSGAGLDQHNSNKHAMALNRVYAFILSWPDPNDKNPQKTAEEFNQDEDGDSESNVLVPKNGDQE